MNKECVFAWFNRLYRWCFPLYRVLYFLYKRFSDRSKIGLIIGYVKPGMSVLDVGANIGFYTILLSRCVGRNGTVYAFEPEEENFNHLKRLTKKLSNVKLVKAACGERSGMSALYKSENLNVDHHLYENDELREKVGVRMVSVDEYLRSERSDVGFVKIDVQGYDCFVVKGMKETLSRSKNPMVIGELWPYGLRQAGSSADEYVSELSRLGFMIEVPSKEHTKDWSLYAEDRGFYVDFIARRPN